MSLGIVAGTGNPALAHAIAGRLGSALVPMQPERFPDGEVRPQLGPVRGADVYVVQPTGPPVHDTLVELLLLLDACRRAGADRITAVVPYFGYARQDRRTGARQPIGARVVAEAIASAGADRVVTVDPHTPSLEAMFGLPVEMLTAVPVLAETIRPQLPEGSVVVAPDLGATRLARHFASLVGAPLGVVSKHRLDPATVRATDVVGDVRGRPVLITDDMISTGATIEAAAAALRANGATGRPVVAATHGLLVGNALLRLGRCHLGGLVVTDSLAAPPAPGTTSPGASEPARVPAPAPAEALAVQRVSIAGLIAEAVDRLHRFESLEDLLLRS